jgi:hypothetical protein
VRGRECRACPMRLRSKPGSPSSWGRACLRPSGLRGLAEKRRSQRRQWEEHNHRPVERSCSSEPRRRRPSRLCRRRRRNPLRPRAVPCDDGRQLHPGAQVCRLHAYTRLARLPGPELERDLPDQCEQRRSPWLTPVPGCRAGVPEIHAQRRGPAVAGAAGQDARAYAQVLRVHAFARDRLG